jgi:hypothetical protein
MGNTAAFWAVMEASNTSAVTTANAQAALPVVGTVAQPAPNHAVHPIGFWSVTFGSGIEETVRAGTPAPITVDGSGRATWTGVVGVQETTLSLPSAGTPLTYVPPFSIRVVSAAIGEVVYFLTTDMTRVDVVVMVFHQGSQRILVRVSPETFSSLFASAARVANVMVSTIGTSHDIKPPGDLESKFPNLKVAYERAVDTKEAVGSVSAIYSRIVVVVGASGETIGATPTLVGTGIRGKTKFGARVPTVTQTTTAGGCEGYWVREWPSCTADGAPACLTIATCATAGTGGSNQTLEYVGTSIGLRPLKDVRDAMYGTKDDVIYVVKPGATATTAKVIRKGPRGVVLLDASFVASKWVVAPREVGALGPEAAECDDLRTCLKRTPLNMTSCAVQAAACNPTVASASGAKLEHGDKKVDLLTLGEAEERALFGSDDRGVFVVSVSEASDKKGKRLFVATDNTASVVEVEYDEGKQTWREVQGTNWILIGSLIGGGVAALILITAVVLYARSKTKTRLGVAKM